MLQFPAVTMQMAPARGLSRPRAQVKIPKNVKMYFGHKTIKNPTNINFENTIKTYCCAEFGYTIILMINCIFDEFLKILFCMLFVFNLSLCRFLHVLALCRYDVMAVWRCDATALFALVPSLHETTGRLRSRSIP